MFLWLFLFLILNLSLIDLLDSMENFVPGAEGGLEDLADRHVKVQLLLQVAHPVNQDQRLDKALHAGKGNV